MIGRGVPMAHHHLRYPDGTVRGSTYAIVCAAIAVGLSLIVLWMWTTQPVWNFALVWPGAHRPVAALVVLFGLGAAAIGVWSSDRRRPVVIVAIAVSVVVSVAVLPSFNYPG